MYPPTVPAEAAFMSASVTRSVVRKQLCAMGCELFEIGVLRMDGRMLLRSGWSADRIDAALAWLRRENARVRKYSSAHTALMR
jgi:hypothetical protein